ncbi:hypothetical protein [Streptomyces sp. CBG33]|uniref:hypothetical protein n=1 Tax=Streptomyces sp. CBG33 TaxID=2762624 RepID=UPI0016494564|nr:hypothetical protein [Streptomyces sp. CBG33]
MARPEGGVDRADRHRPAALPDRPAASFESATAKYASQSTAIGREEATAPRLATGMPWAVAVDHSSPIGEGANSQPSTCP